MKRKRRDITGTIKRQKQSDRPKKKRYTHRRRDSKINRQIDRQIDRQTYIQKDTEREGTDRERERNTPEGWKRTDVTGSSCAAMLWIH